MISRLRITSSELNSKFYHGQYTIEIPPRTIHDRVVGQNKLLDISLYAYSTYKTCMKYVLVILKHSSTESVRFSHLQILNYPFRPKLFHISSFQSNEKTLIIYILLIANTTSILPFLKIHSVCF